MSDFFQKIVNELRRANIKITNERKGLINLLLTIPNHFYLNDLIELANQSEKSVSRASIYRNLPLLKKIGFVREIDTLDGKHTYEVKRENIHHEHLICTECHQEYEFDDRKLEKFFNKIYQNFGFIPKSHDLKLCGICPNCQSCNQYNMNENELTLCDLNPGESGEIIRIAVQGALKKRLLDMGLTKGKMVQVIKVAPLGDPIEIKIRGYELSLRKEEAAQIFINRK